ncbi:MAG: TonB-dependent receptor [candidate division Zixibacteria bacterium]|nr:TonB-dependent receptor [candidate division Zixibacteria bacterium]MBU1470285.1 TonB-dependent receptor [candidate division Zixibacteria bacterium]
MSNTKLLMAPCILLAILLLTSAVAIAGTTGKISGVVTDKETGEALPGVAVSITGTTMGALTDVEGKFNILNVPVGTYALKAQLVGYGSVEATDLFVHVDLTTSYDFQLTTLAVESGKVITVKAERPLILQDQTASLTVVTKDEIQQMPTRGYQDIVGLSSGVVAFKENRGLRTRGSGSREATNEPSMNIRGGRESDVAYYVDGFSQQDPLTGISTTAINNNAIEEVQVTTGGFNAEYGKVSAGVINVTTKEGQKDYHGNVEGITDNFHGDSFDYNVYAVDFSGPLTPSFSKMSFYVSGERRWQRDRSPKATADGVLPQNERDGWTWQGKLRYDIHPQADLRIGVLGSLDKWQEYRRSYMFDLSHMPRYEDRNNSAYIKLTHTISKSTFHTISANFFQTERYRGDGEHFKDLMDYGKPEGNLRFEETSLFRPWDDPETPEDEAYMLDDYLHRNSSYIGLRWDVTSQLNAHNEVQFGAEYQRHTLRYYRHLFPQKIFYEWEYNEAGTDSTRVLNGTAWLDVDNYGYNTDGGENKLDDGWNAAKHPFEIAAYFQDKFEWEGLIVNAGVRLDYFDANTKRLRNEFYPLNPDRTDTLENPTDEQVVQGQQLTEADLEDSKAETQFSPRIGIAYPVSDRTHFRLSYGKFFQRPELQYLYVSYDYLEYMTKVAPYYYPVGNPNLEPEETTAYEIGVTHRMGENTRLDITAYYKDVKNLTEVLRLPSQPKGYPTYRNRDFGTIKGVEMNLKMRRTRNVSLDLSYTFSMANGTGSFASSQRNIAWTDTERPIRVSPLDFDQRHKFTGIVDVRAGKGEGPKLGNIFPLENTGLNVIFNFASGTPYTPAQVYNEVTLASVSSTPASSINSRYGPWTYRVDLKLSRGFMLYDLNFDAYFWVLNVLDRDNALTVYEGTGKPNTTGWLSTPAGEEFVETYSEPNDFGYTGEQLYELAQNSPLNYDIPRLIRFGLRLSF